MDEAAYPPIRSGRGFSIALVTESQSAPNTWSIDRAKLQELEEAGMVALGNGVVQVVFATGHTPPVGLYSVSSMNGNVLTLEKET